MVTETAALVGDAEKEMRSALLKKDMKFQLDIVHVPREIGYKLWQENLSRDKRESILKELKTLLYTLKNSVEKHAIDGDMDRLDKRVKRTLKGLKELANKVSRSGCWRTARFIQSSANYMVILIPASSGMPLATTKISISLSAEAHPLATEPNKQTDRSLDPKCFFRKPTYSSTSFLYR